MSQTVWVIGLLTSVAGALLGQSDLVGEPWKHYLTVAFIVGTAVSGYMVQKPAPKWDGVDRRG